MFTVFNAEQGSDLRTLIRVFTLGLTAFGLKLHVDQITLIQAGLETLLQVFVKSPLGGSAPGVQSPDPEMVPTEGSTAVSASASPTTAPSTTASTTNLPGTIIRVQDGWQPVDNGVGYEAPLSGELT